MGENRRTREVDKNAQNILVGKSGQTK